MSAAPKPGALPAYLRIAEHLTMEIGAGRRAVGEKLPPERTMAAAHGVSMMTLRKALAIVTERGLVERRQGSGNYVRRADRNLGTYALFRLEAPGGGGFPTADLLGLDRGPRPPGLKDAVSTVPWAWRIRRLRALDDIPVAVEEIRLDGRFGDLAPEALSESLYKTYADRFGLIVTRAEDRVGVATLPDWAPETLCLAPGATTGLVERTSFDQYGEPVEVSRTWFHPARAHYRAKVP